MAATARAHWHGGGAAGRGGVVLQPAELGLLSRCLEPDSRCLALTPTTPSSFCCSVWDRLAHLPARDSMCGGGPNNQCERAFSTHVHDTYSPACCASHQLTRCYRMLRERVAANQAYLVFPAYCTLTAAHLSAAELFSAELGAIGRLTNRVTADRRR